MFLETLAIDKVSVSDSTVILSTEPIWGTAFAAVLLGETIGWNTGVVTLQIVLTCTWSSVGPAIQSMLLSLIVATEKAGTSTGGLIVDVDGSFEAVETVIKELVGVSILFSPKRKVVKPPRSLDRFASVGGQARACCARGGGSGVANVLPEYVRVKL